jgi:putative chitinase
MDLSIGGKWRDDQIVGHSHYLHEIDKSNSRLHGNSRIAGDADHNVQKEVINTIFIEAKKSKLTNRDICLLLAIARHESGFNPDAAAGSTSAAGIGQFVDATGLEYGLTMENVFDIKANSLALIDIFISEYAKSANKNGLTDINREIRIYALHHDGPSLKYGGEKLSKRHIIPWVEEIYKSIDWNRVD